MNEYEYAESRMLSTTDSVICSAWTTLFSDPLISLSKLRSVALNKGGLGLSTEDGGISLRSVYWRFYHGLLPGPTNLSLFPSSLQDLREAYNALRRRYLIAPDGRWASDCTGEEENHGHLEVEATTNGEGTDGWDPLSLDGQSPWKTWFAHLDLRATIRQDVERTFPDIPYFTIPNVRKSLTTLLFLFSVLNPDVGYRQGMHELLAVCFLVIDRDSLSPTFNPPSTSSNRESIAAMMATLDRRYVEHDAFGLFQEVMKGAKSSYEWRAEEGPRGRNTAAPPAPIITRCNHLHSSLLRRIDPQLWERLETEGVEAQIWAIRWIRLIFTRELPFDLALKIWDGVFAEDPRLDILDFVCIAMLLLIRNELLNSDYPTLLTNLLHYPAPSTTYPFDPHLMISQAIFLRNNISPTSGVEIVIQNQDLLGVKAAIPRSDDGGGSDTRGPARGRGRGSSRGGGGFGSPRPGVGGIAQGIFERAQAAGLDKAILSTVADLRKNLPDSSTAYSYLPNLPFSPTYSPQREVFSSIPSTSSPLPYRSTFPTSIHPSVPRSLYTSSSVSPSPSTPNPTPIQQPVYQSQPSSDSLSSVKTIKDTEREIAELKLALVGMGKKMNDWLGVLSRFRNNDGDVQAEEAWAGLERVKDGLLDAPGMEVEKIVREWGWNEGLRSDSELHRQPMLIERTNGEEDIGRRNEERNRSVTPGIEIPLSSSPNTHEKIPLNRSDHRCPTTPSLPLPPDPTSPIEDQTSRITTTNISTIPTHNISDPLSPSSFDTPSSPHHTGGGGVHSPALYLSTRNDKPSPSLSRVPFSTSPNPSSSKSRNNKWTATQYRTSQSVADGPGTDVVPPVLEIQGGDNDPLAGMGVSTGPGTGTGRGEDWRNRPGGRRNVYVVGAQGTDPLLGSGVR